MLLFTSRSTLYILRYDEHAHVDVLSIRASLLDIATQFSNSHWTPLLLLFARFLSLVLLALCPVVHQIYSIVIQIAVGLVKRPRRAGTSMFKLWKELYNAIITTLHCFRFLLLYSHIGHWDSKASNKS